jgi:hypothetical protein
MGSHQSFIANGSIQGAFTQTQTPLFSATTSVQTMAAGNCPDITRESCGRALVALSKRLAEAPGGDE